MLVILLLIGDVHGWRCIRYLHRSGPVAAALGISTIHFGVMALNLTIGNITPPLGYCLFIGSRIGGITVEEGIKGLFRISLQRLPRCCRYLYSGLVRMFR